MRTIPTARLIDAVANRLTLVECARSLGLTAKALSRLLIERGIVRSVVAEDVPVVCAPPSTPRFPDADPLAGCPS